MDFESVAKAMKVGLMVCFVVVLVLLWTMSEEKYDYHTHKIVYSVLVGFMVLFGLHDAYLCYAKSKSA